MFRKYHHVLMIILIILLGFYIRLINLTDSGFYTDEAYEALQAQNLGNQNILPYMITHGEFFHIVITKLFFSFLGVSEFSGRMPCMLFGLATIYLAIKLGEYLYFREVGYLAGFLLAVSAWHIKWSIILRPYSLLMFLSLSIIYFSYRAVTSKKSIYCYIVGTTLILSFLTSKFCLALPIIIVFYFLINNEIKNKHLWISLSPAIILGCVIGSYVIWNRNFDIFREFSSQWWSYSSPLYYAELMFNRLTLLAILCMVLSCYLIIKNKNHQATILVIFIATYFTLLSNFFFLKVDRYLSVIIPVVYLLVSIGCLQIIKIIKRKFNASTLFAILILFLLCVGDLVMLTPAALKKSYRENYVVDWREACDYVLIHLQENDYIITTSREPVEYYLGRVDYTLCGEWHEATKLIRREDMLAQSTAWLIVDHGRFFKLLQSRQQEWIWRNSELVWKSNHNYVFKSSIFEKVWKEPCDIFKNEYISGDIIISTDQSAIQRYLQLNVYEDWSAIITEYNTTVRDAVQRNGVPENVNVWFIADKDRFFNSFEYWQRDWILRNFEISWESEYVYLFKND